ncbi:MAG TPA: ADP-ribosylglycohydrolase family protein, partial [Spirochaetota bacterium]|nr:ADP-ribosylglycohydrolase family protein [Spirochaetota bacterium]
MIHGWETPLKLLRLEMKQKKYEGCLVPNTLTAAVEATNENTPPAKIEALYRDLTELKPSSSFGYTQPYNLELIKKNQPESNVKCRLELDTEQLKQRFYTAWQGRCCGCSLGKPVEVLGMSGWGNLNGRQAIKKYLQKKKAWPLREYFPAPAAEDNIRPVQFPLSCRENIHYIEADDDIHYTLIGLKVMEEKGFDFKWYDIAQLWSDSLPYNMICTAETQAFLNFNMHRPRIDIDPEHSYPDPGFTSSNYNPYREWIGAQIRADFFGYAAAGDPDLAAELAWQDARWTHRGNGIYGAMFMAAAIAAAFTNPDPEFIIRAGLSRIPARCKLSEAVNQALTWQRQYKNPEEFMAQVEKNYSNLSPVHTINNALIVVMALLYAPYDFNAAVCTAVMAGLDTDCNGATAGSI